MSETTSTNKKVGRVETITLLNDAEVTLRPLSIKVLRRFMKKYRELTALGSPENGPTTIEEIEEFEDKMMTIFVDMAAIALDSQMKHGETDFLTNPKENSRDAFESLVDQDIVAYVNEVCGGITMNVSDDGRIDAEDFMMREANE